MPVQTLPLYAQLKEALIKAISSGELQPGDQLPSTRELVEQYGMSHMTVRRAISDLLNEGLIYAIPGKGVYVTEPKQSAEAGPLVSFSDDMARRGLRASSRVLAAEIIGASTVMSKLLEVVAGAELVYLRRLRLADGVPMALQTAYLPHALVPGLLNRDLEAGSLYRILTDDYRHQLAGTTSSIEAGLADETQADLLQLSLPAALLITEQLTLIASGQPVEFVRSLYRGDRYKMTYGQDR